MVKGLLPGIQETDSRGRKEPKAEISESTYVFPSAARNLVCVHTVAGEELVVFVCQAVLVTQKLDPPFGKARGRLPHGAKP